MDPVQDSGDGCGHLEVTGHRRVALRDAAVLDHAALCFMSYRKSKHVLVGSTRFPSLSPGASLLRVRSACW